MLNTLEMRSIRSGGSVPVFVPIFVPQARAGKAREQNPGMQEDLQEEIWSDQ